MAKKKSVRVSITKKQQASDAGAELLNLCYSITDDGVISKEEIVKLGEWLNKHSSDDLPAIGYLKGIVREIIEDGLVTKDELKELYLGLERVLPPSFRKRAVEQRRRIEGEEYGRVRAEKEKEQLAKRMSAFREIHERELLQNKNMSDTVDGVKVNAFDGSCDYCQSQDGRTYSVKQSHIDVLPPWERCTHELGCRCSVERMFPDYLTDGLPPRDGLPPEVRAHDKEWLEQQKQKTDELRRTGQLPIYEKPLCERLKEYAIKLGNPQKASERNIQSPSEVSVNVGSATPKTNYSAMRRRQTGCVTVILFLLIGLTLLYQVL